MKMAYIGRKKCGCVVAICVDEPNDKKFTGKIVAEYIADGMTVEHVELSKGVDMLKSCKCQPKSQ